MVLMIFQTKMGTATMALIEKKGGQERERERERESRGVVDLIFNGR